MKRFSIVIALGLTLFSLPVAQVTEAHIVPPEALHPVAESYRRAAFLLELNPVLWSAVAEDVEVVAAALAAVAPGEAAVFRREVATHLDPLRALEDAGELPEPGERKAAARQVLDLATHAVGRVLTAQVRAAREALGKDHGAARRHLETAREVWAAFEPTVRVTDPSGYRHFGECWLELHSALGNPGILGIGAVEPDFETFQREAAEVIEYIETHFGGKQLGQVASTGFVPAPLHSSLVPAAAVGLPPGSDINKQLPRPRQILNMAERGVNESETPLIALGDMAFDSALIFGEPARSLAISCNTCHNKGVTNPKFFIPGLSSKPGTVDVSNAFFAPHANNGHFDPLDIPDLRGLRFTAPYGRNGRFESLREFTRNVIVNEFNGPEPDPLLLDGLVAYMLEFDFLPNPALAPDGRLTEEAAAASDAARRGEVLFHRPFEAMGNRACATCHVPSDNFLDRKRHDIGSVQGTGLASRDRVLDTPTLLGITHTPPYFHDGSLDTLAEVVEWFDARYTLELSDEEVADLTAYLETVGDGVDAYEDTLHTLDAELEEFSFFLSTYDTLQSRGKEELVGITLGTVLEELRVHKWDLQEGRHMPTLDRLQALLQEAHAAHGQGDTATLEAKLAEYRRIYLENVEVLR
jgi:cytochrome c peroxidase